MSERKVKQVVVRLTAEMYDALAADAEANGRTVAQSIRFHVVRGLDAADSGSSRAPGRLQSEQP